MVFLQPQPAYFHVSKRFLGANGPYLAGFKYNHVHHFSIHRQIIEETELLA